MNAKLFTVLFVAAVLLVFIFQNTQVVEIRLLLWSIEISRSLMILGVFLAGILVGALLASRRRHPRGRASR